MAGCRSTLSMSKIKVRISETKFCSFYKTLLHPLTSSSHKTLTTRVLLLRPLHSKSNIFSLFKAMYNWTGLLVEPNSGAFKELLTKKRKSHSIHSCLSVVPHFGLVSKSNIKLTKLWVYLITFRLSLTVQMCLEVLMCNLRMLIMINLSV